MGCLVCSQAVGMKRELTFLLHGFDFDSSLQSGQPKQPIFVFESAVQPLHIQSHLSHLSTQLFSKSGIACEELEVQYLVLCETARGKTSLLKKTILTQKTTS